MWEIRVVCSSCAEEAEVVVADLDDLEREVCACGYCYVVLSIAAFEPISLQPQNLVELPRRSKLPLAA